MRHQAQVNVAIFRRLPIACLHTPRALWLLYIAAEPPDIEPSVGQGRLQRFARLTNTRHPVLAPQYGASGSTPYSCYTACRYTAGHETLPQSLDAGSLSTVYQLCYVIVSFDTITVFIKASRALNLLAMSGRERRAKNFSLLLSCSSREQRRTSRRRVHSLTTFGYANIWKAAPGPESRRLHATRSIKSNRARNHGNWGKRCLGREQARGPNACSTARSNSRFFVTLPTPSSADTSHAIGAHARYGIDL